MFRDEVEDLLHAEENEGPAPPEDFDCFGRRMSWEGMEEALYGEDLLEDWDQPADS